MISSFTLNSSNIKSMHKSRQFYLTVELSIFGPLFLSTSVANSLVWATIISHLYSGLPKPSLHKVVRVIFKPSGNHKMPKTGCLRQNKIIFSQFWGLEVWDQVVNRFGFFWGPSPWPPGEHLPRGLQVSTLSLPSFDCPVCYLWVLISSTSRTPVRLD